MGTFQDILTILRNTGSINILTHSQLSGIWWQLVTSDCTFVSCAESAFLYRFDFANCVQNICAGSRQSRINNGNGWDSAQSLGASFSWTLQGSSMQLSFFTSGRVEIFTINKFNAGLGVLDLSSNDFPMSPINPKLRDEDSIIPESDWSFDCTAALEKQLRSPLCVCIKQDVICLEQVQKKLVIVEVNFQYYVEQSI